MLLSENVFIYKRQINILLLDHFKIMSVSTEKLKTVLAATFPSIISFFMLCDGEKYLVRACPGSILGPLLFSTFIDDLSDECEN